MATLVEFSELVPELLAVAPSCPEPVMVREIRNAARELCEEARCYWHEVQDETVTANVETFEFFLPEDTRLIAPVELSIDGYRLRPTSVQLLNEDDPDWRAETAKIPTNWVRSPDDLDTVRFYPIPTVTYTGSDGLSGYLALKPSRDATSITEAFMERFQETLIHGALHRLFMIEGSPWYNPTQATYYDGQFFLGKDRARAYAAGDDVPKRRIIKYGGY